MEAHSSDKNGENNEKPNVGCVGDVVAEEHEESIKKKISSHPLFGLLIETHLNCLKVSLGELGEVGTTNAANHANVDTEATLPRSSELELDRFMEAYCSALENLKEALEEPQQEMASFIDAMYFQLRELCESNK